MIRPPVSCANNTTVICLDDGSDMKINKLRDCYFNTTI